VGRGRSARARARANIKEDRERDRKRNTKLALRESLLATCRSLRKEHLIPYAPAPRAGGNRQAEAKKGDRRGNKEGNERKRERTRHRVRSFIVVVNPRASLPPLYSLVIVAVPSGGRLWLASRREKQTEERRTERQEETGGQRRTVG